MNKSDKKNFIKRIEDNIDFAGQTARENGESTVILTQLAKNIYSTLHLYFTDLDEKKFLYNCGLGKKQTDVDDITFKH